MTEELEKQLRLAMHSESVTLEGRMLQSLVAELDSARKERDNERLRCIAWPTDDDE